MTIINDEINKQNQITDQALTAVFNRLNKNLKTSSAALIINDGVLKQNVGAANSLGEYMKSVGLKTRYVPTLTPEQIEANSAYQNYKNTLHQQGYDVKITDTKGAREGFNFNVGASRASKASLFVGLATMNPIGMIIGASVCLSGIFTYDDSLGSANLTMLIKEQQTVKMLEHKPVENEAINNDLLTEINQNLTVTGTPTKQPIIK